MIKASKNIRGSNLFRIFVDDFGGPNLVAKFLGVTERTVYRWLASENIPRLPVLALYWETQYGRSLIDTEQVNEIRLLYFRINILTQQLQKSKDILTGLKKLHIGSANDSVFEQLLEINEFNLQTWGAPLREGDTAALEDRATLKKLASG